MILNEREEKVVYSAAGHMRTKRPKWMGGKEGREVKSPPYTDMLLNMKRLSEILSAWLLNHAT